MDGYGVNGIGILLEGSIVESSVSKGKKKKKKVKDCFISFSR